MEPTLCTGRIVGPVPYTQAGGRRVNIPLGPCLIEPVEGVEGQRVDVIWGASGQRSTSLSLKDLEAATSNGHLVLIAGSA